MVLQASTDPGKTTSAQYGVIIETQGMTRKMSVTEDFWPSFYAMIEAYFSLCGSEWLVPSWFGDTLHQSTSPKSTLVFVHQSMLGEYHAVIVKIE